MLDRKWLKPDILWPFSVRTFWLYIYYIKNNKKSNIDLPLTLTLPSWSSFYKKKKSFKVIRTLSRVKIAERVKFKGHPYIFEKINQRSFFVLAGQKFVRIKNQVNLPTFEAMLSSSLSLSSGKNERRRQFGHIDKITWREKIRFFTFNPYFNTSKCREIRYFLKLKYLKIFFHHLLR